jgi:hypothetical protein
MITTSYSSLSYSFHRYGIWVASPHEGRSFADCGDGESDSQKRLDGDAVKCGGISLNCGDGNKFLKFFKNFKNS